MTLRRFILAVAAVLLAAGVIGLLVPISVSGDDHSLGCGTAVASDLSDARSANDKNLANVPILNQVVPHTDYVAQCESSLTTRRAWAIPVAVVGAVVVAGALVVRGKG